MSIFSLLGAVFCS